MDDILAYYGILMLGCFAGGASQSKRIPPPIRSKAVRALWFLTGLSWIFFTAFFFACLDEAKHLSEETQNLVRRFTEAPLIPLCLSCASLASLITRFTTEWRIVLNRKLTFVTLTCLISHLALIAWWWLGVESRLDGSEGTGVGFGAAFVLIGPAAPTILMAAGTLLTALFVAGLRFIKKRGTGVRVD